MICIQDFEVLSTNEATGLCSTLWVRKLESIREKTSKIQKQVDKIPSSSFRHISQLFCKLYYILVCINYYIYTDDFVTSICLYLFEMHPLHLSVHFFLQ